MVTVVIIVKKYYCKLFGSDQPTEISGYFNIKIAIYWNTLRAHYGKLSNYNMDNYPHKGLRLYRRIWMRPLDRYVTQEYTEPRY